MSPARTAFLTVSLLLAQAQPDQTQSLEEALVQAVNQAKSHVLLASPSLASQGLAQALRRAMVERGVKVYILIPPQEARAPHSYTDSLYFAGASIRMAQVSRTELLADSQYVGSRDQTSFQRRFFQAWQTAPLYTPRLQPAGVTVVPYDPLEQYMRLLRESMREDAKRRLLRP